MHSIRTLSIIGSDRQMASWDWTASLLPLMAELQGRQVLPDAGVERIEAAVEVEGAGVCGRSYYG